MTVTDVIILLVLGAILFFIVRSFFKKKKSPCAGCPSARTCKGGCAHKEPIKQSPPDGQNGKN